MPTSKLQRQVSVLLSTHLGQYTIRENHRPDWLDGLELDFYIEELHVGIEVQGRQHFEYVPAFHRSYDGYLGQQARDERKAGLCLRQGVRLYFVEIGEDIIQLIEQLCEIELPIVEHPNYLLQQARYPVRNYPSLDSRRERRRQQMLAKANRHVIKVSRYKQHLQTAGPPMDMRLRECVVKETRIIYNLLFRLFSNDEITRFLLDT